MNMRIAVTFALPAESREFLRYLSQKSQTDRGGVRTIRGRIDSRLIEVLHTGVGERICRQRLERFLSAHRTAGRTRRGKQDEEFDCLISAGFAGAIKDDLQIGELLIARNFSTIDLRDKSASLSTLPIHVADLLTVRALIDSVDERLKLAQTSRAAAVDMETEFIAQTCAARSLPFLSLRVISDTPRDGLPAPANVLFNIERQQTDMLKLAMHLLMHPARATHLVRFARRIASARKTLAEALLSVLRSV
jgi:nucleoside phosphorylase